MPLIAPLTCMDAVVFDFDGTLAKLTIDFNELNAAVHMAVRRVFSQAPKFAAPALEWVATCLSQVEPEDPALAALIFEQAENAMTAVEVAAARRGNLFPHTRHVLSHLYAGGANVGIITRNCRAAVRTVFPDIDEYCPLLTREDVAAPKPDPAHLLGMLTLLRASPAKSLMVGDHPMDILTGQRAGARTVAVTCGHASYEQLRAAKPDLILAHCGELLDESQP